MEARPYDVVIYGATGYTGQLCAQVLAKHPSKPRWAIAGRDATRLKALRSKLSLPESVGTISANNNDAKSVHAMLQQTRSIVNVVGPFRQLGAEAIVKACTEVGTHYFDLSGETGFNATLMERYDEPARSKGIVVCPSVGLDCLPFDLSTYLAVEHLKQEQKETVGQVECYVTFSGGVSTGTIFSFLDMLDEDKTQMKMVRSDWLSPLKGQYQPIQPWKPFYSAPFGGYATVTPFTIHNTRLINQTHGLLERAGASDKYGPKFVYKDGAVLTRNYIVATIITQFIRFFLFLPMIFPPIRWLLRKILPRNFGPSTKETSIRKKFMDVVTVAYSADHPTSKASVSRLFAVGEPGYSTTAQMIIESALLVTQEPKNKLHPLAVKGGVLTSALLGSKRLAERLVQNAQWTIEPAQAYDGKSKVKNLRKSK